MERMSIVLACSAPSRGVRHQREEIQRVWEVRRKENKGGGWKRRGRGGKKEEETFERRFFLVSCRGRIGRILGGKRREIFFL